MVSKTLMSLAVVLFCFTLGILDLTHAQRVGCCESNNSNRVPYNCIVDYRVQNITEGCRIKAIIFIMMKGKKVCASPDAKWVQEYLEKLRGSQQKKKPNPRKCRARPKKMGKTSGVTTKRRRKNNV